MKESLLCVYYVRMEPSIDAFFSSCVRIVVTWSGLNLTTVVRTLASVNCSLPIMYWYKMFFKYSNSVASSRV